MIKTNTKAKSVKINSTPFFKNHLKAEELFCQVVQFWMVWKYFTTWLSFPNSHTHFPKSSIICARAWKQATRQVHLSFCLYFCHRRPCSVLNCWLLCHLCFGRSGVQRKNGSVSEIWIKFRAWTSLYRTAVPILPVRLTRSIFPKAPPPKKEICLKGFYKLQQHTCFSRYAGFYTSIFLLNSLFISG